MALLNKAAFEALRAKTHDIDIPELGGTVRFREWTTGANEEFILWINAGQAEGTLTVRKLKAQALALSIVGEDNEPLMTFDEIAQLPPALIDRLDQESARFNKVSPENVEAAEGNSDAAPSGDSSSD